MSLPNHIRQIEGWLAPSEAGEVLGCSGQWVKQLLKRGELRGVNTHLGWLVDPTSIEDLADARLQHAEEKLTRMKAARQ